MADGRSRTGLCGAHRMCRSGDELALSAQASDDRSARGVHVPGIFSRLDQERADLLHGTDELIADSEQASGHSALKGLAGAI